MDHTTALLVRTATRARGAAVSSSGRRFTVFLRVASLSMWNPQPATAGSQVSARSARIVSISTQSVPEDETLTKSHQNSLRPNSKPIHALNYFMHTDQIVIEVDASMMG
jgi:hypothetical protein